MSRTTWTKESLWKELDEIGESEVRIRLDQKYYSDVNERAAFAREWLTRKEIARAAELEARREASNAETLKIAKSAKNAAWAAAIAAIIAAICAMVAIIISLKVI